MRVRSFFSVKNMENNAKMGPQRHEQQRLKHLTITQRSYRAHHPRNRCLVPNLSQLMRESLAKDTNSNQTSSNRLNIAFWHVGRETLSVTKPSSVFHNGRLPLATENVVSCTHRYISLPCWYCDHCRWKGANSKIRISDEWLRGPKGYQRLSM